MCYERFTDELEKTDTRMTDTMREDELERPERWPEPTEEPEKAPEREKEYAHV